MITTLHSLLKGARRGRYALPAFNVTNLETAQAVLGAAAQMRSPVIVQTSESAITYAGSLTLLNLIRNAAEELAPKIPVVIHLDHGKHLAVVRDCIRMGYTSVHMDGSERRWSDNIAVTKKAVAFGHRKGITVQGELGYLLGFEGMTKIQFSRAKIEALMTDPDKAGEFVKKTGVDTLAIAIGTAHGYFAGKEKIDFKRLARIRDRVRIPLVLHGGSGVSDPEIRRAIKDGIRIINLDTSLRLQFMKGLVTSVAAYDANKKVDVRTYLGSARLTMEREAIRLIKLLGSARKI